MAIASIVPSASPAVTAATSASDRSGGFILKTGSKDAQASSVSARCCGETSHVTRTPSALAARTSSVAAAVERCSTWYRPPVSGGERQVPGHDRRFRFGRPARDPELRRPLPFVHVPAGDEVRILRVLRDHRARQRPGVLERAPHHVRVGHAVAVVGEDPHPEVVELAERRELAPGAALGDAAGDGHEA